MSSARSPAPGGSASPAQSKEKGQWHEYKNADGRSYWAHSITKQSVWEKPEELRTSFERAMANTPWKQYFSKGRPYYVHGTTKETKWDLPKELQELKTKLEQEEEARKQKESELAQRLLRGEEESPEPEVEDGRANGEPSQALIRNGHHAAEREKSASPQPDSDDEGENVDDLGPPPFIPPGGFSNARAAEDAFIYLLRKAKVTETETWDVTMRKIVTDPLYKSLNTLGEKKAVWQRYISDLIANREAIRKARLDKLRPHVHRVMGANPRIKSYSTFRNVDPLLASSKHWVALSDEVDRRKLFDEYVAELKRAELAAEAAQRQHNTEALKSLMKQLPISVSTRWREARDMIIGSDVFKADPGLQAMEDVDILILFESYSLGLLKEHEEEMKKAAKTRLRRARKARDAFRHLLAEMEGSGELTSQTKWKDFLHNIENRPEYEEILGMPGSSPLDLWMDAVDDLGEEIAAAASRIRAAADKDGRTLDLETTPEVFKRMVKELQVTVEEKHIGEAFDLIRRQLEKAAREEKRQAERKRRHLMEDLRYRMKKADPPIDLEGTYEAALPVISEFKEFQSLDDDGRKEAFERFVRRQKEKLREVEEGSSGPRSNDGRRRDSVRERERERERSLSPSGTDSRHRRDRSRSRERQRNGYRSTRDDRHRRTDGQDDDRRRKHYGTERSRDELPYDQREDDDDRRRSRPRRDTGDDENLERPSSKKSRNY